MSFLHGINRIVTDGLVLLLDAANHRSYPGSGTVWYDISGNGSNVSLNNCTYSSGSIVFNGSSSYGQSVTNGQSDGTLLAWFYPSSSPSGSYFEGIIDCDDPGYYGTGFGINNGTFQTILDDQFWNPSSNTDVGSWQMAALTWNSTNAYFYKNSTQVNSLNYTRGTVTTVTYKIGKSNANPRYFNGKIAIASIYNRTLSSTEITQNYNALKHRFGL